MQLTGLDPVQVPAWHVSTVVHLFESSHAVPLAATGFVHTPVLGEHTPGLQITRVEPTV